MRKLFLLFLLTTSVSKLLEAQLIWNFGTSTVSGAVSNLPPNITSAAAIAQVNNSNITTFLTTPAVLPASTGYTGASGFFSGHSNAKIGAYSTASTYLQVVLTPAPNNWINVTNINWGNLSAATGPTAFSLFTSTNNYSAPVAFATASANGNWVLINAEITTPIIGFTSTALTLRIFAHGGTGSQPVTGSTNWRIDDLKITATAQSGASANAIPKYLSATTYTTSVINENNGKIGVGTANPIEKLDINGNIYTNSKILIGTVGFTTAQLGTHSLAVNGSAIFTKAVVRLTNTWPDFVFEPTYNLPTLSQVEAYITKHKHLEGVPSAAEVKEKGIDLGDNQTILLKKVEELTLYMVELNKKVETLAKENEELKKKVNGDK